MARPRKADLARTNRELAETGLLLEERIAELELQLEDVSWQRLEAEGQREFTRTSLGRIAQICRINFLKNPLIKNAIAVQRRYVFGRGVSAQSRDEDVNAVIQSFMDDPKNRAEFTDPRTMGLKEIDILCCGNVFLALFESPDTGAVKLRSFPFDEVNEIICDPEDHRTVWFYRRVWTERKVTETGGSEAQKREALYPDWRYDPDDQPATYGGVKIDWEVHVYHVREFGPSDMKWGVPDVYAAIDWAKAVKEDLENYATMKRALSRFALSLTVKGGKNARQAARDRLATTVGPPGTTLDTNPPPLTGSTFVASQEGAKLDVIKTAGAQPAPDEGRRLWLMVAAAVGLPETILFGDVEAGNLATAKSLDRPTELKMTERQTLWKGVLEDLLQYAVRCSVQSTSGILSGQGTVDADPVTGEPALVWNGDDETAALKTITVDFPDLVEHDPEMRVKAIVEAASLGGFQSAGTIPDRALARALMQTLGFDDVDELLDELFPKGEDTPALGAVATIDQVTPPGDGTGAASDRKKFAAALAEFRDTIRPLVSNGA